MSGASGNPFLIVLGMHRSGTSMLAGALDKAGVFFGKDFIPPQAHVNERGFWEHRDIVRINEDLLRSLGGSWHDPPRFGDDWRESTLIQKLLSEAVSLIRDEFLPHRLPGVKDPRICILLPFWQEVIERLGVEPFYVRVVRPPLEVAISLYRRDKIPPLLGLHLSRVYNEAVEGSRIRADVTVEYRDLVHDPLTVISRISDCLGFDLDEKAGELISEFVSPRLVHCTLPPHEFDQEGFLAKLPDVLPDVLHREWLDFHGEWTGILAQSQLLGDQLQEVGGQLSHAQEVVAERDRQLGELNERLLALGEEHAHAQEVVAERDRQLGELNERLQALGEEHAHAQEVVAERDRQLAELNERLQALGEEHAHAQAVVAERDRQLGELNDRLRALGEEHAHAQAVVAQRDAQIGELTSRLDVLESRYTHVLEQVAGIRKAMKRNIVVRWLLRGIFDDGD